MSGPDVAEWKQVLLGGDTFDPVTHEATKQWQRERKLLDDGVVGKATRGEIGIAPSTRPVDAITIPPPLAVLPGVKLVPAKHQRAANRKLGDVWWVAIHSAETSERPSSAEALGAYFKDPMRRNNAGELVAVVCSAHYSVDSDSIVQHVLEEHVAFHVRARPPGWTVSVNDRTIGIELTGRADQTREEWLDEYGRKLLPNAAKLVRGICDRWGLPFDHVGPAGLLANTKGLTGHADVRDAWHQDTHYDPGVGFPWDVFVELVKAG
jgi:N-acetyl-anhydromuramyl-L-alanine amidase AmpD